MLFVSLFTSRPGTTQAAVRRRLEWKPPEGAKQIAEYWLPSNDPAVIVITEADDMTQIFNVDIEWSEFFDIRTFPAITSEQGLEMSRAMMAARGVAAPAGVKIGV